MGHTKNEVHERKDFGNSFEKMSLKLQKLREEKKKKPSLLRFVWDLIRVRVQPEEPHREICQMSKCPTTDAT